MNKTIKILAAASVAALLCACEPLLMKAELERATEVQTKVLSWRDADPGSVLSVGSAPWRGLAISADGMKVSALCSLVVPIFSGDGGQSWTSGGSALEWNGVASSADGERLLSSVGTSLYYSQNGGDTWNTAFHSSTGGWNWLSKGISESGQIIIAQAGSGTVDFTLNGGASWSTLTGTYYQVNVSGDGSVFALGDTNNDIVVTRDRGASFTTPRALDNGAPITDIALSADGSRIIVSSGNTYSSLSGYLYASTDSGASFTALTSAGSRFWSSVACSSDGRVIVACVENGYIHRSKDGGRIWEIETAPGLRNWMYIASSADGLKHVAVGYNNKYLAIGE